MERRNFLATMMAAGTLATAGTSTTTAASTKTPADGPADRRFMTELLSRMARPILEPMSKGRLQATWSPDVSPSWDGRNLKVGYLKAFGRLMAGIAPWLALPDDDGAEGKLRSEVRRLALTSYSHSVDPDSPDYLLWRGEGQPLVDSAFFTNSFTQAPKQLWEPLDVVTKRRIVTEIKGLREAPLVRSPGSGNSGGKKLQCSVIWAVLLRSKDMC